MKKNHNIIELLVQVKRQTDAAIMVAGDIGKKQKDIWLPKSQIEIDSVDEKGFAHIQIPEWLAEDKGLI